MDFLKQLLAKDMNTGNYILNEVRLPNLVTAFYVPTEALEYILSNEMIEIRKDLTQTLLYETYKFKNKNMILTVIKSYRGNYGLIIRSLLEFEQCFLTARLRLTTYIEPPIFILHIDTNYANSVLSEIKIDKSIFHDGLDCVLHLLEDKRVLKLEPAIALFSTLHDFEQYYLDIIETEKIVNNNS